MKKESLQAGVIGLGLIGGGVASSLINSGCVPVVCDVLPEAAAKFAGRATIATSPAQVAAQSDVIMLAVFNAQQAREVLSGPDGILQAAREKCTVVLLATVGHSEVLALYNLCSQSHVDFLDCGVTPGSKAAENGLIAMIGGERSAVDRAMPVLTSWAGKVVYCGASGTGMAAKVARNAITYGVWSITAEAGRLANAAGVDTARLLDVLRAADAQDNVAYTLLEAQKNGPVSAELADYLTPFMEKDLQAAQALAQALAVDMPLRDLCYRNIDATLDKKPV